MSAPVTTPEAILAECDRRMIALSLLPDGAIAVCGHDIPPALARTLNSRRDTFAPLIAQRLRLKPLPAPPRPRTLTPAELEALDAELLVLGEEIEAQLLSDALEISEADRVLLRVQRWFCAVGSAWLSEQEIGERRREADLPFRAVVDAVYELVDRGQLICCTTYGAPRFRHARPEEFQGRRDGRLGEVYDRAAPVGAGAAGVADSEPEDDWEMIV